MADADVVGARSIRTEHTLAIRKELSRIRAADSSIPIDYVPIYRSWWHHWRSWTQSDDGADFQPESALEVLGLSTMTKDEQSVCWIPLDIYRLLKTLYPSLSDKLDANRTTSIVATRLSRARWKFSWHYASGVSCACCGSPQTQFACGACSRLSYCDARCQEIHWTYEHQNLCGLTNDENDLNSDPAASRSLSKGLVNVGNSCFMSATVQCLFAARPLLKYFLRDEWMFDLGPKHRNIAVAFAQVCKSLAFGAVEYVNPTQLKTAVSQLSTGLFAGYQQHDAEELLLFLLDTLHEELDVVKDKGPSPREDEDQWHAHRRREQSVIDSYMLGSYETATKCPQCNHESLKTDIFKHLNLALPPNSPQRVIVVVVVRQAQHASLKSLPQRACQTRYAVLVKKEGTCEYFQREVAHASRVPFENLWFVSVERGTVIREIQPNMLLKRIPSPSLTGDVMVVAYEIGVVSTKKRNLLQENEQKTLTEANEKDDDRHVICMFARGKKIDRMVIPICISFPASTTAVSDLVAKLKEAVSRSTKETELRFFMCDSVGRFDEVNDFLDPNSSKPFVDFVPGSEFRSGEVRVGFVVCERPSTCPPLKSEFSDHDSCNRLKAQLMNELKGESVMSCLRHFVQTSTLDEENCWKCPKCSGMASATQVVRFTRLPEILILVLKRFDLLEGKITSLVRFDVDGMDMSDFLLPDQGREGTVVYDLFAVVNHYGSMVGGHYTAFVARDVGDTSPASSWEEIDDSKIIDITKEQVVSPAAYILFYRKRSVLL